MVSIKFILIEGLVILFEYISSLDIFNTQTGKYVNGHIMVKPR